MAQTPLQAAAAATPDDSNDPIKSLIAQEKGRIETVFGENSDVMTKAIRDWAISTVRAGTVDRNVVRSIERAIAALDHLLEDQLNAIIHDPDFLKLEAAWRGLDYLVKNTPIGEKVKICVLNVSKQEMGDTLADYPAESGDTAWYQSPIYKRMFTRRLDTPGGEPMGCVVGDFQFDHSPQDISLLERLTRICSAAHAPFLSAAAPRLLGLKSWEHLPDPANLAAKMDSPDHTEWKALRRSEFSRYLSLTLPRFLARLPYGAKTAPVKGLNFEEDLRPDGAGGPTHDNYVWANAAYPMAVNIGKAFLETGFCVRIRGMEAGGLVERLPIHTFQTDDGGADAKCPTEVSISMTRETELSDLGFMPFSHHAGTNEAMFVGAQTVQKPEKYDTDRATENAALSARLPYVFLVSRFAHYLKQMIYRWVGSPKSAADLEQELNEWISRYTSAEGSAADIKEKFPLAEASIEVIEIPGRPGSYEAKAYLRPHIQLESVEVKLGVVSQIPGAK